MSDEGYQIGAVKVPNQRYVDDNALVTMAIEAMQRLLDIVKAWSEWARIPFNAEKCWYYYETYQGRRAIHPDVELTLNGVQLKKANPRDTTSHLGIPVQLDQLCGSGGRSAVLDDSTQFLLTINLMTGTKPSRSNCDNRELNPVNAIQLLDSMAKVKAIYACNIILVLENFLHNIDSIVLNAVRHIVGIPKRSGSRDLMHATTFMRRT